ncbi:hypothetical protein L1887_36498 [Cichorium endivia]|nr:hypothetical protein L1887_36498 [Cichorium endivia]
MASAGKSFLQSIRRYIKKPWEITGPCADPEYKSALPLATDYRPFCPATEPAKAIVPTSDPETVFDIKYFSRDQRRNRPPIRRTVLKKDDIVKAMKEKSFDVADFPPVYLTTAVEEDYNACGGGYCNLAGFLNNLLTTNKLNGVLSYGHRVVFLAVKLFLVSFFFICL